MARLHIFHGLMDIDPEVIVHSYGDNVDKMLIDENSNICLVPYGTFPGWDEKESYKVFMERIVETIDKGYFYKTVRQFTDPIVLLNVVRIQAKQTPDPKNPDKTIYQEYFDGAKLSFNGYIYKFGNYYFLSYTS